MINPIGANSIAPPARRPAAGNAAFRLPGESDAAPHIAGPQIGATVAVSLAGLLALQESAEGDHRQRAMQHGHALLAKLSRLQQLILGGLGLDEGVSELAELAATRVETSDPRLAALIGSVLLRAKIELAKRGR